MPKVRELAEKEIVEDPTLDSHSSSVRDEYRREELPLTRLVLLGLG